MLRKCVSFYFPTMPTAGETRDFVELDEISIDSPDRTACCVYSSVHVICVVGTPTEHFLCLMNYLTFSSHTQRGERMNLPSTVEIVLHLSF